MKAPAQVKVHAPDTSAPGVGGGAGAAADVDVDALLANQAREGTPACSAVRAAQHARA